MPQSSGLAALVAARAAIETREFEAARRLLARADAQVPSLAVPRLMLEAEMRSSSGSRWKRWPSCRRCARKRACTPPRCDSSCVHCRCARTIRGNSAARRSIGQTQGVRARRSGARACRCPCRRTRSARRHDAAGLRAYWTASVGGRSALAARCTRSRDELPRARWRSRSSRHRRPCTRAHLGFHAAHAIRGMPARGRDAPARAGRALARGAQPGSGAAVCARGCCASASSCGARRRPTSRRASRWTTRGGAQLALGELLARSGAAAKRMRISRRRSSSALAELGHPS